jgi:2Fe-2S ferredoxin
LYARCHPERSEGSRVIQKTSVLLEILRIAQDDNNQEPRTRNDMPTIIFKNRDGSTTEIEAEIGATLLDLARKHDIDIEGACEGSLACSTCHVIVEEAFYSKLPQASEDEEDMLDLAFGLTHTSRLGCQIKVTEELHGMTVALPKETHNAMEA